MKRYLIFGFLLFLCTRNARAFALDSLSIAASSGILKSPVADILQKDIPEFNEEEIDKVKAYAISLWNKIQLEHRILKPGQLTPDKIQDFPVAMGDVDPGTGTVDYAICFDQMFIQANGEATLQAYMVFDPPGGGSKSEPMVFMAKDVKFSATGGISSATLTMLGGFTLVENDKYKVTILGSKSGVLMDCNGFKSFDIGGEVSFNKEMMYNPVDKGQVAGIFKLSAASWDDFLVSTTLSSPFEVKGAKGYIFTVQNATIDMSATRNSTGFPFQYIVDSREYQPAPDAWTGFHINNISVQFPSQFKDRKPTVGLSNLIIDKHGVSVLLFGENLIPLAEGNANGWAFSIDTFVLDIFQNTFRKGGLGGKIQLPVMDTPLGYLGTFDDQDNYLLSVSTDEKITFDLWKAASVNLTHSRINLIYSQGKFIASANLTGSMTIGAKLSDDPNGGLNIPSVNFEEFHMQTVKPYLSVKSFGFSDGKGVEIKLAGFKGSISDVNIAQSDTAGTERFGLGFRVKVSLTNIAKLTLGAEGDLTLMGKLTYDAGGRQKWIYDKIQLNELGINVKTEVFAFAGKLQLFREKPIYGSGFRADLMLKITKGFEFEVQAMGLFGTTRGADGADYTYWQVDALTEFPKGIPVGPGFKLIGFGGGAFERMNLDPGGSPLGMSLSGITYRPDEKMGLGIRASISCSFASKSLVAAKVGLEMAFKAEGGLSYISFDGDAEILPIDLDKLGMGLGGIQANLGGAIKSINQKNDLLAKLGGDSGLQNISGSALLPQQVSSSMKGVITANLHVQFLFDSATFHADLRLMVNIVGVLTGGGLSQMHFSPSKWYIRAGQPDNRLGIALNFAVLNARVGTYFMMGHDMPPAPDPPAEIARILNASQKEQSYMRDDNALRAETGIAFGLDFNVNVNANFLMFYANLTAGVGFDVMLKNYGDIHCEGKTEPIGVNGWYANGQIYAYVAGSVGIQIKILKLRKKIEILSIGAASLLQAKMPSPLWMRGIVGGYYSVLGGRIKGQCRFKFEVGDDCVKIQDDPDNRSAFEDVEVIGDISPINGTQDVKVVAPIKVGFLLPINNYVDIPNDDGSLQWYLINFKEAESSVTVQSTGKVIFGKWEMSEDQRRMNFLSELPLPGGEEIKVKLVVGFFDSDGKPLLMEDGQPAMEIKTASFKTDTTALQEIPVENIAYAYPVIGQLNYYKEESSNGFIKLVKLQDEIFENKKTSAVFTDGAKTIALTELTYSGGLITYKVPPGSVELNTGYKFQLLSETGHEILSYDFRASKFSKLKTKLESLVPGGSFTTQSDSTVLPLPGEPFDNFEMDGSSGTERMIQFEADLASNSWYTQYIKPFYETESFQNFLRPRADSYGSPAVKAVFFSQKPSSVSWSGNEVPEVESLSIRYMLPSLISFDIENTFLNGGAFCICSGGESTCGNFDYPCARWYFTPLLKGQDYKINYKYILPDKTAGNSAGTLTMQYQK